MAQARFGGRMAWTIAAWAALAAGGASAGAQDAAREAKALKQLEAFEKWYKDHATEYDEAADRLNEIMMEAGGTDAAARARMRIKTVEGDRERAAQDWYKVAEAEAKAKLAVGDLKGSLAALGSIPPDFQVTSSGAKSKEWAKDLALRAGELLASLDKKLEAALLAGDAAAMAPVVATAKAMAASAPTALPGEAGTALAAKATAFVATAEARQKEAGNQVKYKAAIGTDFADAQTRAGAGDLAGAQALCDKIRKAIGDAEPRELGLRRQVEELWIKCATETSGIAKEWGGVAEKTPRGARISYPFDSPKESDDWKAGDSPVTISSGKFRVPANALVWHKARFPGGVHLTFEGSPGTVVSVLLGDQSAPDKGYKLEIGIGGSVRFSRMEGTMLMENRGPALEGDVATVEVDRKGTTFTVAWAGTTIVNYTDAQAPPDGSLLWVGLYGGAVGYRLDSLRLEGDPQTGGAPAPAPGSGDPAATGDTPAPDAASATELPKGWVMLRKPGSGSGLPGWDSSGWGEWRARGDNEIQIDGSWGRGNSEFWSALVHKQTSRMTFTEYEFACEMRFVKHADGSAPGLMFPLAGHFPVWVFDLSEGPEVLGIDGANPKGTLQAGTSSYLPVKVKVKDGKVGGYIGAAKSWEVTIAKAKISTPTGLSATGLGLVNRKGVAAWRSPQIKFYR